MWNLIYHEMLGVNNLGREISGAQLDKRELVLHHKDTAAEIKRGEQNIRTMMEYILSKENPLALTSEPRLHHILTQEIMPEGMRNDLPDVLENGERIYHQFRKNRFLEKNEKISDRIHRNNIKTIVSIKENQSKAKKVKEKTLKKDMVNAQKLIDLVRVRNFNDKKLFEYNLVPSSYLFDADGLMVESGKSALVREIVNMYLSKEHYTYSYLGEMKHSLVDVMSNVRMKHSYLVDVMSNVRMKHSYLVDVMSNVRMKHSYLVDVMSNVRMKHSYLVDVMPNVRKHSYLVDVMSNVRMKHSYLVDVMSNVRMKHSYLVDVMSNVRMKHSYLVDVIPMLG